MLAPAPARIAKRSEEGALTYVDAPEFLNTVEADDLLEQLVPVLLAAWRLGEPQSPGVLKSVLDVEVLRVIEDGHDLLAIAIGTVGGIREAAFGRDGNGIERHRLRRIGCAIRSDFCHVAGGWQWYGRWKWKGSQSVAMSEGSRNDGVGDERRGRGCVGQVFVEL